MEGTRKLEPSSFQQFTVPGPEAMGKNWSTKMFPLSIREHFCAVQVTQHCHRSSRGWGVSSLDISESYLGMVLGTFLWMSLLQQGVDQMVPKVPANLIHAVIL